MPRDPGVHLEDILDAIQQIRAYTRGYNEEGFGQDRKTQDAVIRNLEIIGEAARGLPESVRSSAGDVEWNKLVGLRNILIHEYFGVSLRIVWDLIQTKLPELEAVCRQLLTTMDSQQE